MLQKIKGFVYYETNFNVFFCLFACVKLIFNFYWELYGYLVIGFVFLRYLWENIVIFALI